MRFIATCKLGLEALVTRQLHDLHITVEKTEDAKVTFLGEFEDMIRALLWLRTAERVLMVVGEFSAVTFDELFEKTKALELKPYLTPDTFIHVTGKSAKSALFSVPDCQRIVKKAIVENLKCAFHRNAIPEDGREIIVEVGLLRDFVTIALDCCGAGLTRRGYRTYNVAAPLSETLGAAIVLLSHYQPSVPLIDPMCGSGTMPIEAAMIAANQAPGMQRTFAGENWPFVASSLWAAGREEAADAVVRTPVSIEGSDIDPRCIDLCKKHAKKAGVMLNWQVRPLSQLTVASQSGIIVCNPPYGERLLDHAGAADLYREMRRIFSAIPGWSVNVFSGVREFEKIYGRRADRRRKLVNGGIQCTLYQYYGVRKV